MLLFFLQLIIPFSTGVFLLDFIADIESEFNLDFIKNLINMIQNDSNSDFDVNDWSALIVLGISAWFCKKIFCTVKT